MDSVRNSGISVLKQCPGVALIIYLVGSQKPGPKDEYKKVGWNNVSVNPNEVEGPELHEYTIQEGIQRLGEMGVLEWIIR